MALSKVDYNSLNVTPAASKALKWKSNANGFETGDVAGAMLLLVTQTASSDSTIDFTSGIDSTYKEYLFRFYDIHPSNDGVNFQFNGRDGSSAFDATKTSTHFRFYHDEADTATALAYWTGGDVAQGTGVHKLSAGLGNDNDASLAGYLHLYNPSNTTFVKHFKGAVNYEADAYTATSFSAGYFNVTDAIDGIQFSYSAGDIDAGTFKLYGVA